MLYRNKLMPMKRNNGCCLKSTGGEIMELYIRLSQILNREGEVGTPVSSSLHLSCAQEPASTLPAIVLVTKSCTYTRVIVKRQMVMKELMVKFLNRPAKNALAEMPTMYRASEYPIRADVFSLLAFCAYTMLRVKCR
jgi:hypothetical protein